MTKTFIIAHLRRSSDHQSPQLLLDQLAIGHHAAVGAGVLEVDLVDGQGRDPILLTQLAHDHKLVAGVRVVGVRNGLAVGAVPAGVGTHGSANSPCTYTMSIKAFTKPL